MIDYEHYRARRWHRRRSLHTLAWLAAWACLSGLMSWLFITRF